MAGNGVRTPGEALDKSSSAGVNFKVLKRISPNLDKILATSGQAALYAFSKESREWTPRDIEGTFFLIENHGSPALQFVILNQKGVNYFEEIGPGFKLEQKSQNGRSFLFYRSVKGEVLGVYFFDPSECPRIVSLLVRLLSEHGFSDSTEQSQSHAQPEAAKTQELQAEREKETKKEASREKPRLAAQEAKNLAGAAAGTDNRLAQARFSQRPEATPPKMAGARIPDASPQQARSGPSDASSSFITSLSSKTPAASAKQSSSAQQVSRTAGLPPVNNAEILEALKGITTPGELMGDHQKKKSEEFSRSYYPSLPAAQTPPSGAAVNNGLLRKNETSTSCPAPIGQQLLKPETFQMMRAATKDQEPAKAAPEKVKDSTPAKPPSHEQQRLRNFFLSSGKSRNSDVDGSASTSESAPRASESNLAVPKASMHESVRSIIKELAGSDVFIDAIVQQLAKKRLLPEH